jgi:HSP20 family protein
MTRNSRQNPFGVILHEMSSVGDEFAQLCNRLTNQEAQAAAFPVNVWHDENAVYVEADLPGVARESLDVTVTGGDRLTIRAARPAAAKVEGATWLRAERATGNYARVIGLPVMVDAEKVEASYTNGVLKVTLPKIAAVKPRTVPVKVGE